MYNELESCYNDFCFLDTMRWLIRIIFKQIYKRYFWKKIQILFSFIEHRYNKLKIIHLEYT